MRLNQGKSKPIMDEALPSHYCDKFYHNCGFILVQTSFRPHRYMYMTIDYCIIQNTTMRISSDDGCIKVKRHHASWNTNILILEDFSWTIFYSLRQKNRLYLKYFPAARIFLYLAYILPEDINNNTKQRICLNVSYKLRYKKN